MSYTPSNSFSKIDDAYVTDIVEAIGEKRTSTYNGNFDTINGAEIADAIRELNLTDALAMHMFDNPASNSNATYSVTNTAERDVTQYAFYFDTKIASVNLPNVTSIGQYAFNQCDSLVSVSVPKATSIGTYAFKSCTNLAEVNCPLASSIYSNAFNTCTSLESVSFPSLIATSSLMCASCTNLKKVKFGSLTSIGSSSTSAMHFNACKNLQLVDFRKQTVIPTANTYIFPTSLDTGIMCYIVVPDSLVDDWRVATNWSKYHTDGTYATYYEIVTEAEYNTARASDSTLPALD